MSVHTSIEELPNIHQTDYFDLCQGDSSNTHLVSVHLSVCLLAGVAQTDATGARGPISDLWTP